MASVIEAKVAKYDKCRAQKKLLEDEMKTLSAEIQSYAKEHGVKDDKGSFYISDAKFTYGSVAKKQLKLNQEKALEYAKKNGLNNVIVTKEEVDEEALSALVESGEVPVADLESMTEEKIIFSVLVKEREDMPEVQQTEIASPKKKFVVSKKGR